MRRYAGLITSAATLVTLAGVPLAVTQVPSNQAESPAQELPPKPDPYGRPPPPTVPFGLSCSDCQFDFNSDCRDIKRADVVVEVSNLQQLKTYSDCYTFRDVHFGKVKTCTVNEAVRFDVLRTLRGDVKAETEHVFYVRHDENPFFSKPGATGLTLLPTSRYVLFASKTQLNTPFGARWFGFAACPAEAAHELPDN